MIHLGLAHPGLAAGVGVRTQAIDDVGNDGLRGGVLRGIGGDDAIAVKGFAGESLGGGGGFGKGDLVILGFSQNLPCKISDQFGFGRCFIDGRRPEGRAASQEVIGIFQQPACPFGGGDELRRPDPTVLVRVNQSQRRPVKLHSGGGARERHPEFLIQLIKID